MSGQASPALLLLSPGILKHTDADFGLPHLVALGSYVQERLGLRVEIVDLGYEAGDRRDLERLLDRLGPFLAIGVSCYSSFDTLRVLALGRFLRARFAAVPLVVGGYHPSALPEDFCGEGEGGDALPFDYVVRGEGELPLEALLTALLGGKRPPSGALPPALVKDLDTLPPYRWELLDRYWPRAAQLGSKLQIYLSRGCPHRCVFCMERAKELTSEGSGCRVEGGPREAWTGGGGEAVGEDREFAPAKRISRIASPQGESERSERQSRGGGARRALLPLPEGDRWRPFSAERALDELSRLDAKARLAGWIVNIADPLFGWQRRWRRQVLEGIVQRGLVPRQFWTLTRSDDLDDEDVALLARGRFAIGVGLESGSPAMLEAMQKTRDPVRYLAAIERLAELSRRHGLTWAANLIVGHPSETEATLRETHDFCQRLFGADETRGWLGVDPFRLYPGSAVHREQQAWSARYGTRFHHQRWWQSWYDAPFRAEHVDPSGELDYRRRVDLMFSLYAPLAQTISERFKGQGRREIDGVFRLSVSEQVQLLAPEQREQLLLRAERASAVGDQAPTALSAPIGLQLRDPAVRRRESAVRRLLEEGLLREEGLIEALLQVPPEPFLGEAGAEAFFGEQPDLPQREGEAPAWLGLSTLVRALEALALRPGERVVDLLAVRGYRAALLARLVGPQGKVHAVEPSASRRASWTLGRALAGLSTVKVVRGAQTTARGLEAGAYDALLLLGAVPRFPAALPALLTATGRAIAVLGPRFARQDLVLLQRGGPAVEAPTVEAPTVATVPTVAAPLSEQLLGRLRAPVLAGPEGWLDRPRAAETVAKTSGGGRR